MLATVCFCFYLCWNVYWLCQRVAPPSILRGVFGIPAPTTGMTRALRALWRGEGWLSLHWNPLAVPFAALYAVTLGWVLWRFCRRQPVLLPAWMAWAWLVLLLGGWVVKLAQGPTWW